MLKFRAAGVTQLVGVDIAKDAVCEAERRARRAGVPYVFEVLNAFTTLLPDRLGAFDVVTCHFGLQYAARSSECMHIAFQNFARALRNGGTLVVTLPDHERLAALFGCDDAYAGSLFRLSKSEPGFGEHTAYLFYMHDAIECVEWTATTDCIKQHARANGMRMTQRWSFPDFAADMGESPQALQIKSQMRAATSLQDDEREVLGLYQILVFQRALPAGP